MELPEFRVELFRVGFTLKTNMEKLIDPLAKSQDLTMLQAMVLMGVRCGGIQNINGVSKRLGIGQANASTMCKKMEKDGFIERRRSADDERIVEIRITQKGETALDNLWESFQGYDELLLRIAPDKLNRLIESIQTINEVVQMIIEYRQEMRDV